MGAQTLVSTPQPRARTDRSQPCLYLCVCVCVLQCLCVGSYVCAGLSCWLLHSSVRCRNPINSDRFIPYDLWRPVNEYSLPSVECSRIEMVILVDPINDKLFGLTNLIPETELVIWEYFAHSHLLLRHMHLSTEPLVHPDTLTNRRLSINNNWLWGLRCKEAASIVAIRNTSRIIQSLVLSLDWNVSYFFPELPWFSAALLSSLLGSNLTRFVDWVVHVCVCTCACAHVRVHVCVCTCGVCGCTCVPFWNLVTVYPTVCHFTLTVASINATVRGSNFQYHHSCTVHCVYRVHNETAHTCLPFVSDSAN